MPVHLRYFAQCGAGHNLYEVDGTKNQLSPNRDFQLLNWDFQKLNGTNVLCSFLPRTVAVG